MHLDYSKTWNGMFLAVLILYGKPVLAVGGDDFTNNLLSDLAPLIALFGEQVTRQYLSQSMHWLEHIIFACAPLGMVTAITCAIRVAGDKTFRAVIGRAREPRAQAEIEVMSSTSFDVCELWNGVGIVRVPGSPDVIELVYDEDAVRRAPDVEPTGPPLQSLGALDSSGGGNGGEPGGGPISQVMTTNSSVGIYQRWEVLKPKRSSGDIPQFFRWLYHYLPSSGSTSSAQELDPLSANSAGTEAQNTRPTSGGELWAPNISLNTSNPPVSITELWAIAFVGVILQGSVLAFDALVTYYWRWGKNGTPVAIYAFWCTFIGTLAVSGGMFICACVIELSTEEHVWEPKNKKQANSLRILWLQRGQTVSDQKFKSYAIHAAKKKNTMTTSRPLDDQGQYRLLTAVGTMLSILGFVFQFVGLRGMNFWATLIQLLAMGIMTLLRVLLRRNLTADLKKFKSNETPNEQSHYVQELPEKHGLDFVARQLTDCESWSLVTKDHFVSEVKTLTIAIPRVLQARMRLGELAGETWLGELHGTMLLLTDTIETFMNHLWSPLRDGIKSDTKVTSDFKWTLTVSEDDGKSIPIELVIKRNRASERDDWGPWKANCAEIEAIISLWIYHLGKQKGIKDEGYNLWIIGYVGYGGDVGRVLSDWWISRETDCVDIDVSDMLNVETAFETACKTHKVHDSRVLYCMNTGKATETPRDAWQPQEVGNSGEPMSHTLQGIINKTSLADMCAQFFLSNFIMAAVKEMKPIISKTTFEPIQGKRLVKIFNEDVRDLAEIIERKSLGNLDDAYRIVIPALFEANILPSLVDNAPEILKIVKPPSHKSPTTEAAKIATSPTDIALAARRATKICDRMWNMGTHRVITLIGHGEYDRGRRVCMRLVKAFTEGLGSGHPETVRIRGFMRKSGEKLTEDLFGAHGDDEEVEVGLSDTQTRSHATMPLLHRAVCARQIRWVYNILKDKSQNIDIDERSDKKSPLHLAAEQGDDSLVRLLLSFGANAAKFDGNGRTALHLAVDTTETKLQQTRVEVIKLLLGCGADVNDNCQQIDNRPTSEGQTPLHLAAAAGQKDFVKLLIKRGALLDLKGENSRTAMHMAAERGHQTVVALLIEEGADLEVKDESGETAMHRAMGMNHQAVVRLLVEKGADLHVKDKSGNTVTHQAAAMGKRIILQYLIMSGSDLDTKDNEGRTALHTAIENKKEQIVRVLIEKGVDLNAKDRLGKTAGYRAAEMGYLPSLEPLIDMGSELDPRNFRRETALHVAASNGHKDIVEFLLRRGANPGARDRLERRPIHAAAAMGQQAILELLVAGGRNPNVKDGSGQTALHLAVSGGHITAVELLIRNSADPDAKDKLGRTPMHKAAELGHHTVLELFLEKGSDPSVMDSEGNTILHVIAAASHKHEIISKLLLDHKVDPDTKNKFGRTPIHKAAEMGRLDALKVLIKHGANTHITDNSGKTAMDIAADSRREDMVELLRESGTDSDVEGGSQLQRVVEDNGRTVPSVARGLTKITVRTMTHRRGLS